MPKSLLKAEEYTIGWITAITPERAAAMEMLDEHEKLPQVHHDDNFYSLGRIGVHNVVIACLPAGKMGKVPAANVMLPLLYQFPSIRFGMMVGVDGGVPNKETNIRLSDVVISQPFKEHGGVVVGKTGKDGELIRATSFLNAPPTVLLNALQELQALEMRDKVDLLRHLSIFSNLTKFRYRGAESDALYNATSDHVPGPTCQGCSSKDKIQRKSSHPVLHYGTIACGDQVTPTLTRIRSGSHTLQQLLRLLRKSF
jgi:nucleoside phosphorylase